MRGIFFPSIAVAVALGILGCETAPPTAAGPVESPSTRFGVAPAILIGGIRDLGTFGGDHGFGFEINDRGDVAGITEIGTPFTANSRAVFWSETTGPIPLRSLGGVLSDARGLNNYGMVVGRSQKVSNVGLQSHPTVWRVGRLGFVERTEIGPFSTIGPFDNGQAEDVNDNGLVVGWFGPTPGVPGQPTAYRWTQRGGLTSIPPVGGPPGTARSQAIGLNNAGDIVGTSTVAPPFIDHAVLWRRNGRVIDIGTLGGSTRANAINDRGEVTGTGISCSPCEPHAFYWNSEDGIIDLGTFGGVRSFAFDIDNQGRVTGWYETANGVRHAYVWTRAGGKVDLPTLGGANSATGGFNTRGQLTGRAEDNSGVLHAVVWQLGRDRP